MRFNWSWLGKGLPKLRVADGRGTPCGLPGHRAYVADTQCEYRLTESPHVLTADSRLRG